MELSQLKYFKAVAEIGKISGAAEALFISAPALSTSISRLESELGVKLFTRTNNRIIINKQGEILLRYVNSIFSALDAAKSELRESVMVRSRHVSIASVATTQWVDMVTAFSQENPHFTLSCTSVKRTELEREGLSPEYNFLLAMDEDLPPHFLAELESLPLFEDRLVLMVNPSHPLATLDSVDIGMLEQENVFLPMKDYTIYDKLMKLYDDLSLPFPAGNAYSHLASQQMVASGLGVGFATAHTSKTPTLAVKYIPISNSYRPWISRVYWRRGRELSSDERDFLDFIVKYYSLQKA